MSCIKHVVVGGQSLQTCSLRSLYGWVKKCLDFIIREIVLMDVNYVLNVFRNGTVVKYCKWPYLLPNLYEMAIEYWCRNQRSF